MGWGPPQAGPAGDAWAAFPEEIVLVTIPASKPPSCTASGRALGATCSRPPSYQVPEEPGFSLVLEAAAFPVGPAQFLGSEASQVGICPAGAGGVLERAPGKGSHPLRLSLQGWGLQLLQPRPPRKQLSTVSAPWDGQPRPRALSRQPQGPWTAKSYKAGPLSISGSLYPHLPKHAMFLPPCLCPYWPLFLEDRCSPRIGPARGWGCPMEHLASPLLP